MNRASTLSNECPVPMHCLAVPCLTEFYLTETCYATSHHAFVIITKQMAV